MPYAVSNPQLRMYLHRIRGKEHTPDAAVEYTIFERFLYLSWRNDTNYSFRARLDQEEVYGDDQDK